MNGDGRIDLPQEFDEAERMVRMTMDFDLDGKPDLVTHYQEGQITKEESSTKFDGTLDV